ncbi:MAG: lamin tail domain-containing protein [Bacteroidota bacterium]
MYFPKCPVSLLLLLPFFLQAQLSDDFSDGDFSNNPSWLGDATHFIVNSDQQLQLNAPAAGTSTLYLPALITDSAVWEMYLQMDFSPSASNSLQVVLQSDQQGLSNGNGYYLFIGETGSDDAIHFYRLDNGVADLLASGTLSAVASSPKLHIRMERDAEGVWTLFADYAGGQNLTMEFTVVDGTHGGGDHLFFGLLCQYTATRTDKFFFDDFLIKTLLPDLEAPFLLSANAISEMEVEVLFNEPLDETSATEPMNYFINNNIGQPAAVFLDNVDKASVHLILQNELLSGTEYNLILENIADVNGNTGSTQNLFFNFFKIETPDEFDILINEIMADPTPAVAIPPVEFIELYNRSNKSLNLGGFGFSSGSSPQIFPDYLLLPKNYVLVCDEENIDSLVLFGDVIGLADFPSLVNSGDELTLTDADGNIVHFVSYTNILYNDPQKEAGGWTLEMINPKAVCQGALNWSASVSLLGGTPGQPNSILNEIPDTRGPELIRAFAKNNQPDILDLFFNEGLDKVSAQKINNYSFLNGPDIIAAELILPENNIVRLRLNTPLIPSIIYEIILNDSIADCSGNFILKNSTTIALPEPIQELDLIINEILFNPNIGGVDFLEIFNRSEKVLNLGDLVIGNLQEEVDTVIREVKNNKLIFPNEYAVLTENPSHLTANYFIENENAFLINDLPSFNNEKGNVTLFRGGATGVVIIDAFNYHEDFHHPLLDDPKGVSLERLAPFGLTNDPNNWHSAASIAGYATPTYKNSQNVAVVDSVNDFFEIPEVKFSPDGDGYQDFLQINYKTRGPGFVAQVKIFDIEGRPVKTLSNNELIGTEGFLRWDGDMDRGGKAPIGIYIVHARVFSPEGAVKEFRKECVVAGQLGN